MRLTLAATVVAQFALVHPSVTSASTRGDNDTGRNAVTGAGRRQEGLQAYRQNRKQKVQGLFLYQQTMERQTVTYPDQELRNTSTPPRECVPIINSAQADIGILDCAPDEHCVQSSTSSRGGLCANGDYDSTTGTSTTTFTSRQRADRDLQDSFTAEVCLPDYGGADVESCDCSGFDLNTALGTFGCTIASYRCFFEGYCGSQSFRTTIQEDILISEYCYGFVVPEEVQVCYEVSTVPSCSLSVNGVTCNSCEIVDISGDGIAGCYEFDCRNTIANAAGNDCLDEYLIESIFPQIFVTDAPTPDFVCDLCEDGSVPQNLDGVVEFAAMEPLTCRELALAAEEGAILQTQCALLQPFFQGPCGCDGDGVSPSPQDTASPVSGLECVTSSVEVLQLQLEDPPITDIVLCPDTTIQVGIPSNPEFSEYVNGDPPLTILRDNVTIRCGDDGAATNQCTLVGGFAQVLALPNHPMVNEKITINNLRLQGLTFTGTLSEIPGVPSQSILISAPGENIVIEDCVFEELEGDSIVTNSRDVLTPYDDYPPFSSSTQIRNSIFRDIFFNRQVIYNTEQTMELENLFLEDLVHVPDGFTITTGSIIFNERGIMSLENSDFLDLQVFTTALYWLASTETSSLSFRGITGQRVQILDADNRDPATYCEEGLIVDLTDDTDLTGTCQILFQNLQPTPPPAVPTTSPPSPSPTLAPTLRPTPQPTPQPTPLPTREPTQRPTTQVPVVPPTPRPSIFLPPPTLRPTVTPVATPTTSPQVTHTPVMSMSYDAYWRRDPYSYRSLLSSAELAEELDAEFGAETR